MFSTTKVATASLVCFVSVCAAAETRIDEAARLSKLTLSAMECANWAPTGDETQRLGEIGIDAGWAG
jgi:hypothetical protein